MTSPGVDSNQIVWDAYRPAQSLLPITGRGSSCRFPQLTKEGMGDAVQHGQDLFEVYHDLLQFLPTVADNAAVKFRVTNNLITTQTVGGIIAGMYPSTGTSSSVLVADPNTDSLEPDYSCPGADDIVSQYGPASGAPTWQGHLDATATLRQDLNDITGVDATQDDWQRSWDHYFDNLSSRQCHGFDLPCGNGKCVTQVQADTVYRLGQWESAYLWRTSKESLRRSVATFGAWVDEFLQRVQLVEAGLSTLKYFHSVAHDGSISRLSALLQLERMVWPGMGAEIVFEIYSRSGAANGTSQQQLLQQQQPASKDWFVRILRGGQPFASSHPDLKGGEMIELSKLTGYLSSLIGDQATNVVSLCNS